MVIVGAIDRVLVYFGGVYSLKIPICCVEAY
jgi:hypothetical protein